ncbi:hypothetical protein SFR_7007 (plasmid) [Streptomyces sp. FR-008]|nr:hypothetical protein SFR_7007 [Streptomyces sp. FR-008]
MARSSAPSAATTGQRSLERKVPHEAGQGGPGRSPTFI